MAIIRNFLFHRVNPQRNALWDPMDVALFDKCIRYITENYEVVQMEELAFSKDLSAKRNFATIMFDDGYKDNITYAADILMKYKCNASFYVVTDCIDKNIPTWTHLLEHAFQSTKIADIDLSFEFFPDDLKVRSLSSNQQRIDYVNRLKPYLKKISHEKRMQVLDKIKLTYVDIETPKLMMNWQDLVELKNAGHYIGSHTITHCMLGTMDAESEIKYELQESAKTIENKLGHFPVTISYPVGSFNEITKKISKETGYMIGLAVKQNIFNPATDDFFEIPRIELYNEPWWKTKLRITNKLESIKTFIRYK